MYIEIALILVLVMTVIGGILVWKMRNSGKIKQDINYQAFFVMGISFLPLGIIFSTVVSPAFMSFTAMGIIYMAIGLSHRDKWKSKKQVKTAAKTKK